MTVLKLQTWWMQSKQLLCPFNVTIICLIHLETSLVWPNILLNTEVIQHLRFVLSILLNLLLTLLPSYSLIDHFQDFVPRLKDHLLSRLLNDEYDGDKQVFTSEERNTVHFVNNLNRVSQSRHFQLNFTTYDIHRKQDTLRPGHDTFIMMLSREDDADAHPFWYAQVLSAFIIAVNHHGVDKMMEVLWVRWLGVMPGHKWGIKKARLPKIRFIPDSPGAFRFLDPTLVLHACHLISAFAKGRTDSLLPHSSSVARENGDIDDWTVYYANM